jgi:Prolipoprotein diacylglyceryl transferase
MADQTFRLVGLLALAAATLVGTLAASGAGLDIWWLALFAPLTASSLVLTAYARQVVTGQERLVLIENATVAGLLVVGLAWSVGQPVLEWADVSAIGIAVFAGVGRMGCLFAGCCHGRPARLGLTYRRRAGAEPPLDLRLFPTQVVESVGLLTIAALAWSALLRGPAGLALCVVQTYGLLRSATELLRGDRPPSADNATAARLEAVGTVVAGSAVLLAIPDPPRPLVGGAVCVVVLTAGLAAVGGRLPRVVTTSDVLAIRALVAGAMDQTPAAPQAAAAGPYRVVLGRGPGPALHVPVSLHVSVSLHPGGAGDPARALSAATTGVPIRFTTRPVAHALVWPGGVQLVGDARLRATVG